jgi:hypothetical protein
MLCNYCANLSNYIRYGNFTDVFQEIVVNDLIPPSASPPADITDSVLRMFQPQMLSRLTMFKIIVVLQQLHSCLMFQIIIHVTESRLPELTV